MSLRSVFGWLSMFYLTGVSSFGQKPGIDSTAIKRWTVACNPTLSNNGKYASYAIQHTSSGFDSVVIRSTNGQWGVAYDSANIGYPNGYSADNRFAFVQKTDGHLGIVHLGDSIIEWITNVSSFKIPSWGKGKWLAYFSNDTIKRLVLRNLSDGEEMSYMGVLGYWFDLTGSNIFVQSETSHEGVANQTIQLIHLANSESKPIWTGEEADGFTFDGTHTQLTFFGTSTTGNRRSRALWFYKAGFLQAEQLAVEDSLGMDSKFEEIQGFSPLGDQIFFSSTREDTAHVVRKGVMVDIYSYKDAKLQSQQRHELGRLKDRFGFVVWISDRHIIHLTGRQDILLSTPLANLASNQYELILHEGGGDMHDEWNWNPAARASVYLVDFRTGERRIIDSDLAEPTAYRYVLTPGGKYILYFDPVGQNYFGYEINSGERRDLTKKINASWISLEHRDDPDSAYQGLGIAGWMEDGETALLNSRYDIYLIDPSNRSMPQSLTNGYGSRNHISFRLGYKHEHSFVPGERIILNAFDWKNKDNGYFQATVGKRGDPLKLTMQPYLFNGPSESMNVTSFEPMRARDTALYLIRRADAAESENFFLTPDFRNFTFLSNNHPESAYNWISSELINYRNLDGSPNQGILYKPQNFDSSKKYPLIFYYYEKVTERLHDFLEPALSIGQMNIPYFVSIGYLVFSPDVVKRTGHPGKSAFNSIMGAANYLSKFSWVDEKHMGLQGHSFGGFETDYMVTHTSRFAAAMSASGMSDFISCYGSIYVLGDGTSRQRQYELYHDGIGATLWERQDLYVENSPVLKADRVTTPLLMMNNIGDGDVPYAQGPEFFTALRRLRKKVWMLQYDGEDHSIDSDNERASFDLTTRMMQFFDYYLRGNPPPIWMTRGVPARMKAIDSGLELDKSGATP